MSNPEKDPQTEIVQHDREEVTGNVARTVLAGMQGTNELTTEEQRLRDMLATLAAERRSQE